MYAARRLPASLINRLPKLRMLGMTGVRNASLDAAACACAWRACVQHRRWSNQPGRHCGVGTWLAAGSGSRDSLCRREYPCGAIPGRLAGRHQPGGKNHRDHRTRPSRVVYGQLLPGAEHDRPGVEPEPIRRAGASGRRHFGFQRDPLVALRCDQHPSRAVAALARADRRIRYRPDEVGCVLDQYFSRSDRGRGGDLIEAVQSPHHCGSRCLRPRRTPAGEPSSALAFNTVLTPHLGYGVQETWTEFL